MIDRVAGEIGRTLKEVPVGFKWFVDGLYSGEFGFGGEESAGASFLRKDGTVWTTDKDGFILALLAAEILAVTGKDPQAHYDALEAKFGRSSYRRIDAPANSAQKAVLSKLDPALVEASTLAGEPILAKLTKAPGNDAAIGGLKVVTENGWFAARPPAPSPSTRSTWRASRARRTWTSSSRKPSRSSPPPWPRPGSEFDSNTHVKEESWWLLFFCGVDGGSACRRCRWLARRFCQRLRKWRAGSFIRKRRAGSCRCRAIGERPVFLPPSARRRRPPPWGW
jgi:hypothetical protein